jgi:MFS family permease
MLSIYVVAGTNYALDLYMYSYFWELNSSQVLLAAAAYPAGAMLGTFFSKWAFARWGKRTGLIIGSLGWAFWQTAPVALRLMGFFPENSDMMLVPLLIAMKLIQGAFVAQADVGFGSLVADVVDEHELAQTWWTSTNSKPIIARRASSTHPCTSPRKRHQA